MSDDGFPRAVWVWAAPPPEGKQVQVWVAPDGTPLADMAIVVSRAPTPEMPRAMLLALLAECE